MAGETKLNRKRLKMQRENHFVPNAERMQTENHFVPTYLRCLTVFNNDFSDYLALRRYRFFFFSFFKAIRSPSTKKVVAYLQMDKSACAYAAINKSLQGLYLF